jgi:molybdate transport system substrate-binding protein
MATRDGNWRDDWSVAVQLQIARGKRTVLDEKSANLLSALDLNKSTTVAARSLGISYRHAWLLVQEANSAAGLALTETAIGGQGGGGTRLTEAGHAALRVFSELQTTVRKSAAKSLQAILAAPPDQATTIHLFAAVSLQEAVGELLAEYSLMSPTTTIHAIFGASNALADQIVSGSAADVFVSASGDEIDRLAKSGMVRRGSRRVLARNSLAIVATQDLGRTLRTPAELPTSGAERFVVADPACPLGHCTAEYLESIGVHELMQRRLIRVDNSRAVLSALRDRHRAIGIIFGSDLANAPRLQTLFRVPLGKASSSYEGAVLTGSSSPKRARALLDFLSSKQACACFRRCGFVM